MQIYPPGTRKGNRTCVLRVSVDGRQHEKVLAATTLAAAKKEAVRFLDSIKGRDPAALVSFEEAALPRGRAVRLDLAQAERQTQKWPGHPARDSRAKSSGGNAQTGIRPADTLAGPRRRIDPAPISGAGQPTLSKVSL